MTTKHSTSILEKENRILKEIIDCQDKIIRNQEEEIAILDGFIAEQTTMSGELIKMISRLCADPKEPAEDKPFPTFNGEFVKEEP